MSTRWFSVGAPVCGSCGYVIKSYPNPVHLVTGLAACPTSDDYSLIDPHDCVDLLIDPDDCTDIDVARHQMLAWAHRYSELEERRRVEAVADKVAALPPPLRAIRRAERTARQILGR